MKLLLTTDTLGGVWTYCMELARALGSRGIDVCLVTMGGELRPSQRREVRALGGVEVFESRFKLEWMDDPWDDVRQAGHWLLELESRLRPDVVHLNGYAHGALPWRAPVLVVAHSCVLSWWEAVKHEPTPVRWETYRLHVQRGLDHADAVVAPTRAMLDAVLKHYGPPSAATRVIANARDPSLFRPRAKEPIILAAGRLWDEAKNLGALIQVAPRLSWSVHVAGEERHPGGGRPIDVQNVEPLGYLSPGVLARWMGRASIYALPARYEPFGLSALEAALSGCALVLGDIASLREVWQDAAVYVPPDDTAALEDVLQDLIRSPNFCRERGRRAKLAAARYVPRAMADTYVSLYRRMVERHSAMPGAAAHPHVSAAAAR